MAAVDAWDAWFRWRDADTLHDLTIEETWHRVASALCSVEPQKSAAAVKARLIDALMSWRLLLDERILATAGTGTPDWASSAPVAVLNVAAFVTEPFAAQATLNLSAIESVAAFATRMLDNALVLCDDGANKGDTRDLRIGVIGFADALTMCRQGFDTPEARRLTWLTGRALKRGCFAESVRLARERGAGYAGAVPTLRRVEELEIDSDIREMAANGIRHARLTAITSQRRLAMLANNVADALDPAPRLDPDRRAILARAALAGPDIDSRQLPGSSTTNSVTADVTAQLELRAAMQPWIDSSIDYPVRVDTTPSAPELIDWSTFAQGLGLPRVTWRLADSAVAA